MSDNDIPRKEHPRPQFQRQRWVNLNGLWTFALDPGLSGLDRGLPASSGFERQILIPFCPESELSGVGHRDFIEAIWYHRRLPIPFDWQDTAIVLHFGAVDYYCEAFLDGRSVGHHWGGSSSFSFDITGFVEPGAEHDLVLHVRDRTRSRVQPCGKQSQVFDSYGCLYTRTTGIWQTVWLEAVAHEGLEDCFILPDLDNRCFRLIPRYRASARHRRLRATLRANGETIASTEAPAADGTMLDLVVPGDQIRTWSPESPCLYNLDLQVLDSEGVALDSVRSYAGLRKIHTENGQVFLNNQPFYQRLVLDQGFYPTGIWTAPSDDALRHDIEIAQAAGFNGARLHQKVFEERFHYWADRLGYLTWGESASWGLDLTSPVAARNFLSEWREVVVRDRNHPSIVTWTPFNETRETGDGYQHHRLHVDAYELTHQLDPSRPVNDASGYVHVRTDLWTVHTYEQDPTALRELLAPTSDQPVFRRFSDKEVDYAGQPYILDEFGGIKWIPTPEEEYASDSWGYGDDPTSLGEFYDRLQRQVQAVLSIPEIVGFCYTQLTDVEQEQNGIYTYQRETKLDMDRVRRIFEQLPPDRTAKAAGPPAMTKHR